MWCIFLVKEAWTPAQWIVDRENNVKPGTWNSTQTFCYFPTAEWCWVYRYTRDHFLGLSIYVRQLMTSASGFSLHSYVHYTSTIQSEWVMHFISKCVTSTAWFQRIHTQLWMNYQTNRRSSEITRHTCLLTLRSCVKIKLGACVRGSDMMPLWQMEMFFALHFDSVLHKHDMMCSDTHKIVATSASMYSSHLSLCWDLLAKCRHCRCGRMGFLRDCSLEQCCSHLCHLKHTYIANTNHAI